MFKSLIRFFGIGPKPVPPYEKMELEIILYNSFKNFTKLLEDKFTELDIEIKAYEEKLEKVKAEKVRRRKSMFFIGGCWYY